ncbi:MAG TPA: hypothetical protein VK171_06800 [Fimbriimonas sp.]|nr:hypothetical protein [Fimbriimonas sp.]
MGKRLWNSFKEFLAHVRTYRFWDWMLIAGCILACTFLTDELAALFVVEGSDEHRFIKRGWNFCFLMIVGFHAQYVETRSLKEKASKSSASIE